ncbi:MAG: hypothetical protein Q9218_008397, partial [Villophora microphyllina]
VPTSSTSHTVSGPPKMPTPRALAPAYPNPTIIPTRPSSVFPSTSVPSHSNPSVTLSAAQRAQFSTSPTSSHG